MQNNKVPIIGIITFVIVLVVGYGSFLLYVAWPVSLGNVDKAGVFGDSFGVLTSLFSGIAIILIFVTMLLQKKELEFVKTQLADQNKTLIKQNFESTFFQLLRLHNETTNSIECQHSRQSIKGSKCFNIFYDQLKGIYHNATTAQGEEYRIDIAYDTFFKAHQNAVSRYFRNLYAIIKFVENSADGDPELYVGLIRVQLSDNELLLLFYHSLSSCADKRLKQIIEQYGLFES